MKHFRYRAKKSPSETVDQVISADTEDAAIAQINEKGWVVVHIEEVSSSSVSSETKPVPSAVSQREGPAVTRLYRQLARMVRSGIPIIAALKLASEQTESNSVNAVLTKMQADLNEGHSVAQAFGAHPDFFSVFDLAMIHAGEAVGRLDQSFSRIGQYRSDQEKLFSKLRGALAYPIFILAAGIAALIFMLTYVLPKFSAFFLDLEQELPWLTRALISLSGVLQWIWPVLVILAVFLFWIVRRSFRPEESQRGWHQFYLSFPKAGQVILRLQIARFARTLSLLLQSGITLLKAMETALPVVTNMQVRMTLEKARHFVMEGSRLGDALTHVEGVPALVVHLIRSGEEAGRLQEALIDIADGFEQDAQESLEILTKLIEPVLILMVGGLLGIMVIAVLLPVFSMNAIVS